MKQDLHVFIPREFYHTRFRVETLPTSWPKYFTIVTACAPTGLTWSRDRTVMADEALRQVLHQGERWHHRITGYDPNSAHAEPGWAIEQSLGEGIELAKGFDQVGIYFVDDGELWVVMCANPELRSHVAHFFDRLDDPFPSIPPDPRRSSEP